MSQERKGRYFLFLFLGRVKKWIILMDGQTKKNILFLRSQKTHAHIDRYLSSA